MWRETTAGREAACSCTLDASCSVETAQRPGTSAPLLAHFQTNEEMCFGILDCLWLAVSELPPALLLNVVHLLAAAKGIAFGTLVGLVVAVADFGIALFYWPHDIWCENNPMHAVRGASMLPLPCLSQQLSCSFQAVTQLCPTMPTLCAWLACPQVHIQMHSQDQNAGPQYQDPGHAAAACAPSGMALCGSHIWLLPRWVF